MVKKQKDILKSSLGSGRKLSRKEVERMIDEGVFDKFILKDIARETGEDYKELYAISKDLDRKSGK